MTNLPTPAEVLAAQSACAKAWEESRSRNGIDRMKLIYAAFPHAVNGGGTKGGLHIYWNEEQNALEIADMGGFLTLLDDPEQVLQQLFRFLSMEAKAVGAVRELITGVPKPKLLQPSPVPKIPEEKLTLGDLGL